MPLPPDDPDLTDPALEPLLINGVGGWVKHTHAGEEVLLRFGISATGRLVVQDLYMHDLEGITNDRFRKLPLARIEAAVNRPRVRGTRTGTPSLAQPRPAHGGHVLRRVPAGRHHGHGTRVLGHRHVPGAGRRARTRTPAYRPEGMVRSPSASRRRPSTSRWPSPRPNPTGTTSIARWRPCTASWQPSIGHQAPRSRVRINCQSPRFTDGSARHVGAVFSSPAQSARQGEVGHGIH